MDLVRLATPPEAIQEELVENTKNGTRGAMGPSYHPGIRLHPNRTDYDQRKLLAE